MLIQQIAKHKAFLIIILNVQTKARSRPTPEPMEYLIKTKPHRSKSNLLTPLIQSLRKSNALTTTPTSSRTTHRTQHRHNRLINIRILRELIANPRDLTPRIRRRSRSLHKQDGIAIIIDERVSKIQRRGLDGSFGMCLETVAAGLEIWSLVAADTEDGGFVDVGGECGGLDASVVAGGGHGDEEAVFSCS